MSPVKTMKTFSERKLKRALLYCFSIMRDLSMKFQSKFSPETSCGLPKRIIQTLSKETADQNNNKREMQ